MEGQLRCEEAMPLALLVLLPPVWPPLWALRGLP